MRSWTRWLPAAVTGGIIDQEGNRREGSGSESSVVSSVRSTATWSSSRSRWQLRTGAGGRRDVWTHQIGNNRFYSQQLRRHGASMLGRQAQVWGREEAEGQWHEAVGKPGNSHREGSRLLTDLRMN